MRPSPVPSRRAVIVGMTGATAAVLADLAFGLRGHHQGGHRAVGPSTGGPPADAFWQSAARDEQALLDAYEAAGHADPTLAATLALPLAHHRMHLAALSRTTASSTAVPSPTTSTGAAPDAASVTARRARLRALMAQETRAADRHRAAAVKDLAGGALLAQIAAADAVHADYLAAAITSIQPPAPTSSSPRPLATAVRTTSASTSTSTSPRTTSPPARPSTLRSAPTTPRSSSVAPSPSGPTGTPTPTPTR